MLRPVYTKRFEKDVKLAIRRGMDKELLKEVIRKIILEDLYRKLIEIMH